MIQKLISIDPGTEASGVAIFEDEKLVDLKMMNLPQLTDFIRQNDVVYVIEDVEAIKTIYQRNKHSSTGAGLQIAQRVGLVKATGRHIVSFMAWYERECNKIAPRSGNWGTIKPATGKLLMKRFLEWDGPSNKDTRSAAFFGYLYLRRHGQFAFVPEAIA